MKTLEMMMMNKMKWIVIMMVVVMAFQWSHFAVAAQSSVISCCDDSQNYSKLTFKKETVHAYYIPANSSEKSNVFTHAVLSFNDAPIEVLKWVLDRSVEQKGLPKSDRLIAYVDRKLIKSDKMSIYRDYVNQKGKKSKRLFKEVLRVGNWVVFADTKTQEEEEKGIAVDMNRSIYALTMKWNKEIIAVANEVDSFIR